jgi:hypothetical protein
MTRPGSGHPVVCRKKGWSLSEIELGPVGRFCIFNKFARCDLWDPHKVFKDSGRSVAEHVGSCYNLSNVSRLHNFVFNAAARKLQRVK